MKLSRSGFCFSFVGIAKTFLPYMYVPGDMIKAVYLLYPHDILNFLNLFRSEQRKGMAL